MIIIQDKLNTISAVGMKLYFLHKSDQINSYNHSPPPLPPLFFQLRVVPLNSQSPKKCKSKYKNVYFTWSCYKNLISAGCHEFPIGAKVKKNKVPTFSPLMTYRMFDKQMKTRTGVYERRTFLIIYLLL